MLKRKDVIKAGVVAGLAGGLGVVSASAAGVAPAAGKPLQVPKSGRILVAYAVSGGATLIDFAGPWEAFGEVMIPSLGTTMRDQMPFDQILVGKSRDAVETESGMWIVPDYTFANAPQPDVLVVGAQPKSAELLAWLKSASKATAVTASVCTGAFLLADAGLLDGLRATTHHAFYDTFSQKYPNVQLVRGVRYVENERISTAGGLTSGIALALRIVERYWGSSVARATGTYMEYQAS